MKIRFFAHLFLLACFHFKISQKVHFIAYESFKSFLDGNSQATDYRLQLAVRLFFILTDVFSASFVFKISHFIMRVCIKLRAAAGNIIAREFHKLFASHATRFYEPFQTNKILQY